jgi:hypothetical protein
MVRLSRLFSVIPAQAGIYRLSSRELLNVGVSRHDGYRMA